MDLVSVIIPTYNSGSFLETAINSVRAQTYKHFEIIVVDDCSLDNTFEIAKSLAVFDSRIRVFQLEQNKGPSGARNRGIQEAEGEFIALLDADDSYLPERLEVMINSAKNHNLDLIADNLFLYDLAAKEIADLAFNLKDDFTKITMDFLLLNDQVNGKTRPMGWIKPIFRKSFLDAKKIEYDESIRIAEDFYFYSELILQGANAVILKECYYLYTTKLGLLSKKISLRSQTKTDYPALVKVCDKLLCKYRDILSANQKRLLLSRRKNCQAYSDFYNFKDLFISKDYLNALRVAHTNPDAIILFIKRLPAAISRRVI